ncbi:hypothetical protein K6V98_07880 [Collinsella sp. AGMB00827]|uniref:MBG domain-containing protein n=1 Tax=Collinsella ureilytica TaxID=2869515 RepID=A0ABS7MMI1_9ACTN|nr:hypothetical protein [Collinsella urealyticum]MBY4798263.1 hypothetical protein [Collinsella urealyticum]
MHVRGAAKAWAERLLGFTLACSLVLSTFPIKTFAETLSPDSSIASMAAHEAVRPATDVENNAAPKEADGDASHVDGSTTDTADESRVAGSDEISAEPIQNAQESALASDQAGTPAKAAEQDSATQIQDEQDTQESQLEVSPENKALQLLSAASGSTALPASSAELQPGRYIVSANISMMTPIGINGYTTNPFNPEGLCGKPGIPSAPVQNNASLIVGADGSRTLTVDLVNPVFTVQEAGSSEDVRVISTERVPIEKKSAEAFADDYERYNRELDEAGISSRISRVTVNLENWSGSYHFGNWKVYATTLTAFFPSSEPGWSHIKTLDLSVDLAQAKRIIEGSFTQTYKDDATGIEVDVQAEEGAAIVADLADAHLSVEQIEAGTSHKIASRALEQFYIGKPVFSLKRLRLINTAGQPIELAGKAALTVKIPVHTDDAALYRLDQGAASMLPPSIASGVLTVSQDDLGEYALVENQGAKRRLVHTKTDAATGVSVTYATDGSVDLPFWGAESIDMAPKYFEWVLEQVTVGRVKAGAPDSFTAKALATAQGSTSNGNFKVAGSYAVAWGVGPFPQGLPFTANYFAVGMGSAGPDARYSFKAGRNPLSVSLPVTSPHAQVYFVSGTVGKGALEAKRLDADILGMGARTSINNEDLGMDDGMLRMFNAVHDAADGLRTGEPQNPETKLGWLVVVEPAAKAIEKPYAQEGLVYNGGVQTGVAEGEGYEVASGSADVAGSYTALVSLKPGYMWSDGSTAPLPISWSIEKAPLVATYVGEQIKEGTAPKLAVEVTGFVGAESAKTAQGYVAPTVTAPDTLASGTSVVLTPAGGAAANYRFTYVGGTLAVLGQRLPVSLEAGTYSVTANLAMPGAFNPLIPGLTVYANNPSNPFGPTIDENDPAEVGAGVPSFPLKSNAQLIVSATGARTLILPIKNPIFTTQSLGTCPDLVDVRTERVRPTAAGGAWSGSYNKRADRIHMMSARLPEGEPAGKVSFNFAGSILYAVPLDKEIRPAGAQALCLTLDYDSAQKISESTELPAFAREGTGGTTEIITPIVPQPQPDPDPKHTEQQQGDEVNTTRDGLLAAGVYTVSANIWVDKGSSGLPLQPHFTSAAFPPMNPVSGNAELHVDDHGRAQLIVPILIQSRIMQVKSLSGLPIISSTSAGGGLSSIVLDLGVLHATDTVITIPCHAEVRLGDLAASIIGGSRNRSWDCVFQMRFRGTSNSGGGEIPAAAQAILDNQGKDGKAADAKAEAEAAEASALAHLNARSKGVPGAQAASRSSEDAPWVPAALAVAAVVVTLGCVAFFLSKRPRAGLKGKGAQQ